MSLTDWGLAIGLLVIAIGLITAVVVGIDWWYLRRDGEDP